MRGRKLLLQIFIICYLHVQAQDSVKHRIIFIGDAGEINDKQNDVLMKAASQIIAGKTTVIYLGDNIYPHGMGLPGSKEENTTHEIIQSEYKPMREKGAPVYFVPGNHDWDKSGPDGLAKIKRQWEYLQEQGDSLVRLVPPNGCPDPVAINISDSVVVIAFDSEWWLYPYDKTNTDADCECTQKQEVVSLMEELFYKNRYKTILLADHHPFQTYGTHGGYFSLKDHIFPLTALKHYLYIPLPVIGSLYPLLRKTFTNPEDVKNPLYQYMIKSIDTVFKNFPNVLHVSGHEHGLQLIDNKQTKQVQIVSGAGAKHNHTIKGKNSLFALETQGFVTADELTNSNMKFTFYTYKDNQVNKAFDYTWEKKPYKVIEDSGYAVAKEEDSVTVAAHPVYNDHGGLHHLLFGKNFRKEWAQPVTVPLIKVSNIHGGLTPEKLGGGLQTTSLRLKDKNGKEYALRNVEKTADLIVPNGFQGTLLNNLLDDATSAQHPYSALIMPPILDAVHVPHPTPIIGVVAPDKSLRRYQSLFINKMALLEQRDPLGDGDSFEKMRDEMMEDNDNSYDANNFLRARYIDIIVGDWDRHSSQWRFYNLHKKDEPKYYIAMPRDRDMVFNLTEGSIPKTIKRQVRIPRIYGFTDNIMKGSDFYFYKSQILNAYPASQLNHTEWMNTAQLVKDSLTDAVIETALQKMPRAIYAMDHDRLFHDLKARRDRLPEAAEKYYRLINKYVDIRTSNKNEFVNFESLNEHQLQLTIRKINKEGELKGTLVSKLFPDTVTKEIRLFVSNGDDSIVVNNNTGIKLRIVGGKGHKVYDVIKSKKKINVYDREAETYNGKESRLRKHISKDTLNTAFTPTNQYNLVETLYSAAYNLDDGPYIGFGLKFTRQKGFRKTPYASVNQFMVSHAFATRAFNITYNGEWVHAIGNADFIAAANIKAPDNTQNFFGRGNETEFIKKGDYKRHYRTRFDLYELQTGLKWRSKYTAVTMGPAVQYYNFDRDDNAGRFINNTNLIHSYDSATINKAKIHAGAFLNYVADHRNNRILPSGGTYFNLQLEGYDGLNKFSKSYGRILPQFAFYGSLNTSRSIVVSDRIGGGVTIGKSAFYQSIFLGSEDNLYGYRKYRFAGQHAAYNNLELRIALTNFGNYLVSGQFGIGGFYDVGRVWEKGESSDVWHQGVGGYIYLAPASLVMLRFNMSHSPEGWYPFFTMSTRF